MPPAPAAEGGGSAVDESLYSRQLYVMGHEAQRRMATSNVLIVGANGLGAEIAKNVILAGVKSVTMLDDGPAQWSDLSAQFYLTEADLGKPRAATSVPKLAELNRYVSVSGASGEVTEEMIAPFQVVVMVDTPLAMQMKVNDFCRAKGACFISCDARGVFAYAFCDFGEAFTVTDVDGNQAASCVVSSVTKDAIGLVTVMDDQRHNLVTGNVVTFNSIQGMPELEGREFSITEKGPFSFEIDCDTSDFGTFVSGYVNQARYCDVKKPATISFRPLVEALASPEPFMETDFAKIGRPGVLHQAFRGLDKFRSENGALPEAGDMEHAEAVFAATKGLNDEEGGFSVEGLDDSKDVVVRLSLGARGVLNPVCAALGGVVGQEVLKACSGKFSPIKQWMYYDAFEALPEKPLPKDQVQPLDTRYDGSIMVFGKAMQEMLGKQKMFLVGAGAIGCEMLKNWAMMGVGCSEGGNVHVTDMDHIEKSNLSRQFLFREADIGRPKSSTAAGAVSAMNPSLNITPYEAKCAPESEELFSDDFYAGLTAVCTALDNVEARLYMDQRCLFYRKPMLESGTLGTKGNTQIVVPHLTENYGASRDPPEKSIPVCTLKNFPNQIEHTLQWSRDWFEGCFKQNAEDANQYLSEPDFKTHLNSQHNTKLETLTRIWESLKSKKPQRFEDCITWARLQFQERFHNEIAQLLHNFPVDSLTSSGNPFWSGAKRPPTPLDFDASDPLHMGFVKGAAVLRAINYSIASSKDDAAYLSALKDFSVPEFRPLDGVKIATTEAEAKEQGNGTIGGSHVLEDVDAQCERILKELPRPEDLKGFRLEEVEFDKDLDDHMEFVTAASNLRARVYKIPEADMHRSRQIAGKIIPAIATTTALVTGLVCMEVYKIMQDKPLEAYKNWFLNLALPQFSCSEPLPPAKNATVLKGKEWKWSAWDSLELDDPTMTLEGLFNFMKEEHGLEVTMLSHGVSILYSFFANKKKIAERLPMTLPKIVELVTKKKIPALQRYLIFEVCVSDVDTDEDREVPYLRLKLR
ncbi:unnamed protein product [Ascophyllum nodosum]